MRIKAFLLFAIFICVLIAGCDTAKYTVVISNKSTKTVSYVYNGSADTLAANAAKTYAVKAYTQPPQISTEDIEIKYNSTTGDYTFIDKNP